MSFGLAICGCHATDQQDARQANDFTPAIVLQSSPILEKDLPHNTHKVHWRVFNIKKSKSEVLKELQTEIINVGKWQIDEKGSTTVMDNKDELVRTVLIVIPGKADSKGEIIDGTTSKWTYLSVTVARRRS